MENIYDLSINNCYFIISNFESSFFDYFNNNVLDELNESFYFILKILKQYSKKINSNFIIDINFSLIPKIVNQYQIILNFFYNYLNQLNFYTELVLIRFPQIFEINTTIFFDYEIVYDMLKNNLIINKSLFNIEKLNLKSDEKEFYKNYSRNFLNDIHNKLIDSKETIFKYPNIIIAGTFDHFHIGHSLLLQTGILLSDKQVYIGLTSDEMMCQKMLNNNFLFQSNKVRYEAIESFLKILGVKNYSIKIINDPFDFSITDATLKAITVSTETIKGGTIINGIRKKNNLEELKIIEVNLINRIVESL